MNRGLKSKRHWGCSAAVSLATAALSWGNPELAQLLPLGCSAVLQWCKSRYWLEWNHGAKWNDDHFVSFSAKAATACSSGWGEWQRRGGDSGGNVWLPAYRTSWFKIRQRWRIYSNWEEWHSLVEGKKQIRVSMSFLFFNIMLIRLFSGSSSSYWLHINK